MREGRVCTLRTLRTLPSFALPFEPLELLGEHMLSIDEYDNDDDVEYVEYVEYVEDVELSRRCRPDIVLGGMRMEKLLMEGGERW